ncbi:Hypothetical Protein FCC1311_029492 [Hondaea fermentalgiana]|uniref:BZIP domain-containing protein n=1 Tax=Hondaea fermentalgiana TaxID=2315210 RepID=A0A2R5GAG0_9STRA|nr:Hypothetical Protein FCC1311_029492 [Hondaea fermentalgiana]|eukprot:GBG26728.1 Hypothetical Protein FCC1311_029492 [Hondaea fermentalgiana]
MSGDLFEFDLLLPGVVTDSGGMFLEENMPGGHGASNMSPAHHGEGSFYDGNSHHNGGMLPPPAPPGGNGYPHHHDASSGPAKVTSASRSSRKSTRSEREATEDDGNSPKDLDGSASTVGGEDDAEKKAKRRKQIAAASRMSRARRKRELEDLRDENERLREERSQFLAKIGELQLKVESLREQGSTDMRIENELLRAQLEEHKRFVACFKRLSEGAPSSVNARHAIYKQGADTAQAHVLGLVSQSQADQWTQATVPLEADLPYQNLSVFYKFIDEYGSIKKEGPGSGPGGPSTPGEKPRRRLNVRVDVLFPGIDAASLSEFFWESFSNTATTQRLYSVRGVEITPLTDDMPDKDTKMLYYRERWNDEKDQDLVLICNRRRKELAKSTLALPYGSKTKPAVGKVAAMIMALSTTQHSAAPEYENANRINSLFVQGAIIWNVLADSRLCVVFSFPDDIKLKAINSIDDVINSEGAITMKFVDILKSYRQELGNRI